jgi:sigma-B regulation protein RsbU (phosphoserine phosphatase)
LTSATPDEELHLAREIQRMLLPRQARAASALKSPRSTCRSQEVGGDYYDFVALPEGSIGVAIGDIAGKGIPGALLMSNLQAAGPRRRHAQHADAFGHGGAEQSNQPTTTSEKYATFFYGILWPENKLTYTNAGHNYPLRCDQDGAICELPHSNLIVGVREGIKYDEHHITLQPGDTLIFYTDGLTEATNRNLEEFGVDRLGEVTRSARRLSAEAIRNAIYDAVLEFAGDTPQADDLTLVVVKVK